MTRLPQYTIWFWQNIVSPHMAGLAAALAELDCDVVYVAQQAMSDDRRAQGWVAPGLGRARLEIAATAEQVAALVEAAPGEALHICGGLRGNGLPGVAQRRLRRLRRRQWLIIETVDDHGLVGLLRRLVYAHLCREWRSTLEGVLAIGHRTSDWLVQRGMPPERVFPFAYFLPPHREPITIAQEHGSGLRILYVGQLIALKRVDLLMQAVASLDRQDAKLRVVGSGPLVASLKAMSDELLPGRVHWVGQLPLQAVAGQMARADALVLPSRHDGWGAVVSEALLAGTPAICSDACGAAGVVRASGEGGVFRSGDRRALTALLAKAAEEGSVAAAQRATIARWARCLSVQAGAAYLLDVLQHVDGGAVRPAPPWQGANAHG